MKPTTKKSEKEMEGSEVKSLIIHDYLKPFENEQVNRIRLTKTFLKLWMVFATAVVILESLQGNLAIAVEEFFRTLIPPVLFLYGISKKENPIWVPIAFYYALLHLNINVFFRPDTIALDIFLVLPLVLSAHIAMKRSSALIYSGLFIASAVISFLAMEFYHKTPVAIVIPHQSKDVIMIMVTLVLCAGLLNHFKKLYDSNLLKLEESLQRVRTYNKDNQLLINIITHDINNHLGRLLMSVELLEDLFENPKKFKKHQELAVNGVMDIKDIINNFKKLRGEGQEDLEFKVKQVSVASVLHKLELIFKDSMDAKKLKLIKTIHENVASIAVEPISFSHHLLANIMGNAIKFSEDEGELEVVVTSAQGKVHIDISNICSIKHLPNLERIKKKKNVISLKGTKKELGQGLGMKLVDEIGQFSSVHWVIKWEVLNETQVKVVNCIIAPEATMQDLKKTA